jgi:pimeloyl-ACP methyl ester carboxylesterase
MNPRILLGATLFAAAFVLYADGPADNVAEHVRKVPPPGIAISAETRAQLEGRLKELGAGIEKLREELTTQKKGALRDLLPDVEIFHKAVRFALENNEIYKTNELDTAAALLTQGTERLEKLRAGQAPWGGATGLVVRGYRSRIDDSIQPFGLVVPPGYNPGSAQPYRLDLWFHGRGETLTELDFIHGRQQSPGEFTPRGAIVLHLYGRYCNGSRFAGETDTFEALERVQKSYSIDSSRIVVRGFSLGGAACWHTAAHHAGLWAAAAPGAGFSETAEFLKVFQNENLKPAWYEQKLWHLYDSTDYALNFYNCPVVAYSGEIDKQKQAAEAMELAFSQEGMVLAHVIGAQTAHKYEPRAREEVNRRIDSIVDSGRPAFSDRVRFVTWTLRYNEMNWVRIDGMGEHWERASVDASVVNPLRVNVATRNVSAVTLSMPSGHCPLDPSLTSVVVLDGQSLPAPRPWSDRSWTASFFKGRQGWEYAQPEKTNPSAFPRKIHGLQGPIDDAFMDRFIFVRPTGTPLNEKVGQWAKAEMARAIDQWKRQYRGEAIVKDDNAITDEDVQSANLVLWGDPQSNRWIGKVATALPILWTGTSVALNQKSFESSRHVPILIAPNPSNPKRYIVLNSGFTFREYDYLNNARQTPKLPDYAVVNVDVAPSSRSPGEIVEAGFFDEQWRLKP